MRTVKTVDDVKVTMHSVISRLQSLVAAKSRRCRELAKRQPKLHARPASQWRLKAPPATKSSGEGGKNKKVGGGTECTFLFQGKIIACAWNSKVTVKNAVN